MLIPTTEAELSQAVRDAGAVRVIGGGTRGYADRTAANEILSTRGLSGISLYEPGALTLVAASGTPLNDIEAALEAEGQMLAFEPMDHRALLGTDGAPTIGGVAAANISGPRRIQAGAARDAMLGVRFVDGRGDIIKNGGRVMKNVTGYDLVKLMAGSFGTLGVMSEVSLKVLPKPEAAAVCLIEGLSDEAAVRAMAAALGSPYDVTGAAHLRTGLDGAPVTMIRVEGFADMVAYRSGKLREMLSAFGDVATELDPERIKAGWGYVRDVVGFADQPGDVWRVSVKPSDGPKVVEAVAPLDAVYDWGGGLVWMRVANGADVHAAVRGFTGHATRVRGGASFSPHADGIAALSRGLKAQFDPMGKLNPGVMI